MSCHWISLQQPMRLLSLSPGGTRIELANTLRSRKTNMTKMSNGTIVTDIDAMHDNSALAAEGYTVRAIETWHDHDVICILWDAPEVTAEDCPF